MLLGIPHTDVDSVWMEALPWIEAACKRGGLFDPEFIRERLKQRDYQLWIYRTPGIDAVCVTEIRNFPLCRICDLIIGTGRNRESWQHCILFIEDWARAQGCQRMRPIARTGWTRIFKQFGYRQTHAVLEKEL